MPTGLNPQRVTRHVRNKGHRLHAEGRVHRLPGSFVVLVEGDTPGSVYAVPCQGGRDLQAENTALRAALERIERTSAGTAFAIARAALVAESPARPQAEVQVLGCTCVHHGLCGHIMAAKELNERTT